MVSISFLRSLPNTRKCDSFPENAFWKMINFSEKVNAKNKQSVSVGKLRTNYKSCIFQVQYEDTKLV